MSDIEWTDETWNPVSGCVKVSQGCKNCYAEGVAKRFWGDRKFTDVQCHVDRLKKPLHWRKPRRVFVNSMSDLFHEDVPDQFIDKVFAVMALSDKHTFQVLTKRPKRMRQYLLDLNIQRLSESAPMIEFRGASGEGFMDITVQEHLTQHLKGLPVLPNVWLGVSAEDQNTADERIPLLLDTPAAVRFVSAEPLLGPLDLRSRPWDQDPEDARDRWTYYRNYLTGFKATSKVSGEDGPGIDWVIVGGESGPYARPCDVNWIRGIVGQCQKDNVPCFVKQLGSTPGFHHTEVCGLKEYRDFHCSRYQSWTEKLKGEEWVLHLKSRKGNDPSEWPEGLRVQQFPETAEVRS